MNTSQPLKNLSRSPGMRITPQRQVILEELSAVTSHPTAAEVYEMVRARLPRIGLGTIYRNLDAMADSGIIARIDIGGSCKRFDANTEPHCHIRCRSCGRVEDVMIPLPQALTADAEAQSGYTISDCRVEFSGLCSECRRQGKAPTHH